MDTKSTNNNKLEFNNKKLHKNVKRWFIFFLTVPIVVMTIFMCMYPRIRQNAQDKYENPLESELFLRLLYQSNFVLYKDIYEKINGTTTGYYDLFLNVSVADGMSNMINLEDYLLESGEIFYSDTDSTETLERNPEELKEAYLEHLKSNGYYSRIDEQFVNVEENFKILSEFVDYKIIDNVSKESISNSGKDMEASDAFVMYLKVTYDENGYMDSVKVRGEDSDSLLKRATQIGRQGKFFDYGQKMRSDEFLKINETGPRNCTIYYGITEENRNKCEDAALTESVSVTVFLDENGDGILDLYNYYTWDYVYESLNIDYTWLIFAIIILGLFLPLGDKKLWENRFFRMPFEVVICVFYFFLYIRHLFLQNTADLLTGKTEKSIHLYTGLSDIRCSMIGYGLNFIFGVFVAMLLMCIVYNLRQIGVIGLRNYFKHYSYIYRFFPFVKRQLQKAYDYTTSFDVSTATNKIIIRLLIANGIIVLFICCFWFMGFVGVVIYSLILYVILRKYISDLKKKYEILLQATNRIAEGNLNVTITENLGVFEPFKPQIEKIQEGFRNAVDEEVKSQKMKTELITNVSHDLKTPLTAIITYVNLLKEENITEEQRQEYVNTLERKSMRLKVLIEDLFEVSKANSRNLTINLVEMDLVNLLKQVQFELEEKMEISNLSVRMNSPEKVLIKLDSQKAYRIYENLLNNVCKYAMEGTRVYLDVFEHEDKVEVVLKNISSIELTVNPSELTERFVRGDESRNTEGSGLGLAIAKSFVELMNGKMSIEIDGDLFKVITVWYK